MDYVTFVTMDDLLAQSDVVTLHARSNGAIMTDREFAMMKGNELKFWANRNEIKNRRI